MSLSRARFDQILFERAQEAGAECLEGVAVNRCLFDEGTPIGVEALSLSNGKRVRFGASLVIDASGRNSRLMVGKQERVGGRRGSRLYALKAHFKGVAGVDKQVELYFFPQGYGGLTRVEDGLANLCFIVAENALKHAGGDASSVVKRTLMTNSLARERLQNAEVVGKWHSAGPLTFGRRCLARDGIIAIGDASGMIDPFTGTGIQMALKTGEMAAEAILEAAACRTPPNAARDLEQVANANPWSPSSSFADSILTCYSRLYEQEFDNRLKIAGLLRTAAFSPSTASLAARVLARAPKLTSLILRSTRSGNGSGARAD
jgi:flavin-dependent dehydrogenase